MLNCDLPIFPPGRIQLMAKLAEGTGFQIPAGAAQVLNPTLPPPVPLMGTEPDEAMMAAELARQAMASVETANAQPAAAPAADASTSANPPINTTCFMLTNMFDPTRYVLANVYDRKSSFICISTGSDVHFSSF